MERGKRIMCGGLDGWHDQNLIIPYDEYRYIQGEVDGSLPNSSRPPNRPRPRIEPFRSKRITVGGIGGKQMTP